MTIDDARKEFEYRWYPFTHGDCGRGGVKVKHLKALEAAVMHWLGEALKADASAMAHVLRRTAEAREIVRRGKLDLAISVVRSG